MKLLRLVLIYVKDFTLANLTIAKQVMSPKMDIHPETIEMETQVEKPVEVLALSNMITFTPGTLTLQVDPGARLVVHVLDDAEGARRAIRERLEDPLLEITRKKS